MASIFAQLALRSLLFTSSLCAAQTQQLAFPMLCQLGQRLAHIAKCIVWRGKTFLLCTRLFEYGGVVLIFLFWFCCFVFAFCCFAFACLAFPCFFVISLAFLCLWLWLFLAVHCFFVNPLFFLLLLVLCLVWFSCLFSCLLLVVVFPIVAYSFPFAICFFLRSILVIVCSSLQNPSPAMTVLLEMRRVLRLPPEKDN